MEEVESERDYFIRKQLKEIFNTTEDNFKSAKEFKDYEEFVEDLIYNLVKGIDVEQTKKTIDDYKKHNLAAIANNQSTRDSRMEMEEKQIQEELQRQEKNQLAYQVTNPQYYVFRGDRQWPPPLFCVWCRRSSKTKRSNAKRTIASKTKFYLGYVHNSLTASRYQLFPHLTIICYFATSILLQEASREPATTANKGEASSAPADGAMQAQRMNPVLQLIYSRPLPEITNDKAAVVLEGNEYVRRLYAAGGYLHANYDLRNWTEIRSQLL